jgi:molybdopterin molybdotransferase
MASCGVVEVFAGVRMKPGRPAVFGVTQVAAPQYAFGLPGNPMAALIAFAALVKPFLLKASGLANPEPQLLSATLAAEVHKRPGVTEFVPVMLQWVEGRLVAVPLQGRRSHMFGGLALATGLAMLPEDSGFIPAGGKIFVLRWGVA